VNGLAPRNFCWIISGRLAVSERPGGYGITHRRVRREEEVSWLRAQGFTRVLSLLPGTHNLKAYEGAGMAAEQMILRLAAPEPVFEAIHRALAVPAVRVLVHGDDLGDEVAGVVAGYLVHAGLLKNAPSAVAIIEELTRRPLGPRGCALVPAAPPQPGPRPVVVHGGSECASRAGPI